MLALTGMAVGLCCSCQAVADPPAEADERQSGFEAYSALHPYLNDEFSPGEGGESGIDDLGELMKPETPVLDLADYPGLSGRARKQFDSLHLETGLRLGFAATALGITANGGEDPRGSAYDLDFMSAWTLVGRDTPDTGVLVATAEFRDRIGSDPASAVGPQLGTLVNTVHTFNDREWVVRDVYWLQRFNQGKLRVLIGRADTADFFGQQPMQNANTLFANRNFSANPTVPFPGHGAAAGVSYRPSDRYYLTGGVADGYNLTTETDFDTLGDGDFFYSIEAGWTPQVEGMGTGRYSVTLWHIDSRRENGFDSPSDDGVTLVAGQQLGDRLQAWARYAHADGATTNIRRLAQAGVGYTGLFGSPSNMSGLAVSFAGPRSSEARDEKVVEVFERIQLTRFTQLSAGFQVVFDPGENPDEDRVELLYARLRHAF